MRMTSELRQALRILRRSPGTTAVIVLLLGLGIGANAAMFSVVNGVLLQPLPFEEAGRLLQPCETHATLGSACVVSPPNAMDWRERAGTLEALGIARDNAAFIRVGDAGWTVTGGLATPGLFEALRVRPTLGRGFVEADMAEGRRDVILLTDALWRERFGADHAVVGSRILHDGVPVEVAGVLPPDFAVPRLEHVRLWRILPFDPRDEENRDWRGFRGYARLADGATLDVARAELARVHADLAREHPDEVAGYGVSAASLHDVVTAGIRPTLLVFAGALGLLLVVACVNIAHLLLAQAIARRSEFAVRAALGASRRDLARPLAVQAAVLGGAGAVLAIIVALWARSAFITFAPASLPRLGEVAIDARVFAFAALLAIATTVAFASVPAGQATHSDIAGLIRQQSAGRARHGMRRGLIIVEVALTTVLLVGAALLARSFAGLLAWEPGFETRGLATFWAIAPAERYTDRPDATAALWRDATDVIAATPGVTSAGTASAGPLFGGGDGEAAFRTVEEPDGEGIPLRWYDVGSSYFHTLGLESVAGRDITSNDVAGAARVALVNQTAARRLTGSVEAAVGRRLIHPYDDGVVIEVVGIVPDVPPLMRGTPVPAEIYWPLAQAPRRATYFVVRTSTVDVAALAPVIERRIAELDPELRLFPVRTLSELVGERLIAPRFQALLLGAFALLALALAAAGTYGLIAWSVAVRAQEIGIRMALGAGRGRVVRAILREGLLLVGAGAGLGIIAALWLARGLRSMLFGVGTADPAALVATVVVLAASAVAASIVPARRAARADPVRLMHEG